MEKGPEYMATDFTSERQHQSGLPGKGEEQASQKGVKAKDRSAEGLAGCRRRHGYRVRVLL